MLKMLISTGHLLACPFITETYKDTRDFCVFPFARDDEMSYVHIVQKIVFATHVFVHPLI